MEITAPTEILYAQRICPYIISNTRDLVFTKDCERTSKSSRNPVDKDTVKIFKSKAYSSYFFFKIFILI